MKCRTIHLLTLLVIVSHSQSWSQESPVLEPFPEAEQGMTRFVLALEEQEDEEALKVELRVGEIQMTDGVNLVRMGGEITPETLEGWGYTYYVAERGPVMSTLMAPRPGGEQVETFVAMKPLMIRYNSRLPVVVYVPEGMEVRYRIWTAGPELMMSVNP